MISQFVNPAKRKKKLLGELYDFPEGTMAIGRLDEKSEGLLFLTTNGIVSAQVRSKKIEKEYFVQVAGETTSQAILQLQKGVTIKIHGEVYQTLPCKVKQLNPAPDFEFRKGLRHERHGPTSWLSITIKEGKFRQVRKMTAAVGFPTLRLIRVRIDKIKLDDLAVGGVLEVDYFI